MLLPLLIQAQKTNRTVTHNGITREYIEYVPESYDGSTAVPLLFVLHGLGDTDDNMSNVGFEQIANSENFIVITPQAIASPLGTAWNSGAGVIGITLNPTVDDVGFIGFLIDSVSNHYNINLNKVYSTGFSMGGFMSNRLACELNDRIAAIASVAGTIGSAVTCEPGKAVPFLHFHGTSDGTVGYTNNTFGTDAVETVEFWADNNGCDATPTTTAVPDSKADGITIEKIAYNNCGKDTEFYKATGAGHSWLNSTNNDLSYTLTIWEFLSRQSLETSTGVFNNQSAFEFNVYPNPLSERSMVEIFVEKATAITITIYDITGKLLNTEIYNAINGQNTFPIEFNNLSLGMYVLTIDMEGAKSSQVIVVQ